MKKLVLLFLLGIIYSTKIQAQDTCLTALPITAGTYAVGVINGTQIPTPVCAVNGDIPAANIPAGEWYSYTPTQNYTVTISSDIAANTPRKDTRFHVYTGTCSTLTCYNGDDDSGTNYSSIATFSVTAGTTYYIAWDNRWLSTTTNTGFSFELTESTIIIPPTPITYTTQTISTINSSYNICVVDMNGDNKDDIVGVNATNMRVHFQGNTPGTFTYTDFPFTFTAPTTAALLPNWSMAAGDYNKDGFNDLVLGNGSGATIITSNNTGTVYTANVPGQYIFSQRTNFTDLNNNNPVKIYNLVETAQKNINNSNNLLFKDLSTVNQDINNINYMEYFFRAFLNNNAIKILSSEEVLKIFSFKYYLGNCVNYESDVGNKGK